MAGLWSFLRRLWFRRRRPARPPGHPQAEPAQLEPAEREPAQLEPVQIEPAQFQPPPAEPPPPEPPVEPAAGGAEDAAEGWDDEEDDDGQGDDDEEPPEDEPDPFINPALAEPEAEAPDVDLELRRAESRAAALGGEHRIYLSMKAGPGSLAEALNELSAEGLVEAAFVDDAENEPYILYRPVCPSGGATPEASDG